MQKSHRHFLVVKIRIVCLISVYVTKQASTVESSGHQPVDRDRLVDLLGIPSRSPNISVKKQRESLGFLIFFIWLALLAVGAPDLTALRAG